ncbi:hypothetical protein D3C74_370670 [compost metagenome]
MHIPNEIIHFLRLPMSRTAPFCFIKNGRRSLNPIPGNLRSALYTMGIMRMPPARYVRMMFTEPFSYLILFTIRIAKRTGQMEQMVLVGTIVVMSNHSIRIDILK